MKDSKVIIISPDGSLHFSYVDERGHAAKLIEYYDENNIDYNKEQAMFVPSQVFAFNLSNIGYIVFLVEPKLTCIFLKQNYKFTYEQINALKDMKGILREILNDKVISFNLELNDLLDCENKIDCLINYVNNKMSIRR